MESGMRGKTIRDIVHRTHGWSFFRLLGRIGGSLGFCETSHGDTLSIDFHTEFRIVGVSSCRSSKVILHHF